jgi:hypothetical protein
VRFQVLKVMSMKMAVFWNVAPGSLVDIEHFKRAYCFHNQGLLHHFRVLLFDNLSVHAVETCTTLNVLYIITTDVQCPPSTWTHPSERHWTESLMESSCCQYLIEEHVFSIPFEFQWKLLVFNTQRTQGIKKCYEYKYQWIICTS